MRVAVGPRLSGIGTWEWLGADVASALESDHDVVLYENDVPETDLVVLVKYHPDRVDLRELADRVPVVYCPVDRYAGAGDLDDDARWLQRCSRIVVHAPSLAHYFSAYAPVVHFEHAVRYVAPPPVEPRKDGPLLWIGHRSNVEPVARWANEDLRDDELWVLTNGGGQASQLGFHESARVRVDEWTAERHVDWTTTARAALDVKGDDFRQRNKPSAKAFDFLASGLPLATNAGGSTARRLAELGFDVPEPSNRRRWLSRSYWEETIRFGAAIRELHSPERIACRWRNLVADVLEERV